MLRSWTITLWNWPPPCRCRSSFAADEEYFRRQPSGRQYGYGGFGRNISGVISHADLAANLAGLHFYRDVVAGRFRSFADYVTADWCEEHCLNEYTPEIDAIVQQNGGR